MTQEGSSAPRLSETARIEARITQAYDEWANGASTSPSPSDLVLYAAEVMGVDLKKFDAIIEDHMGNKVFEMQSHGADEGEVARYLHKELDDLRDRERAMTIGSEYA